MDQNKIDRINALYHKSKAVGLTEEEKMEQAALRKEYIETIRKNMRAHLNNISIQEKDGTITEKIWWNQRYPVIRRKYAARSGKGSRSYLRKQSGS